MLKRPIPIGIENYREMISRGYYYVDKTLLIKEILDHASKVYLMTKPRRFGKTLGLSMLQTFFEDARDREGNKVDNLHYFDGKKIMDAGEDYISYAGKYPVIKLSLKSAKQPDFDTAYRCLADEIAGEFRRHDYVLETDVLNAEEKVLYSAIMNQKADYQQYATSIQKLSGYLERYHGNGVVILIDEYDVPLENAWFDKKIRKTDMLPLIRALEEGDCTAAGKFLSAQLMDTISFYDYQESYYHGFLAGILKCSNQYIVLSNREAGTGRSDLMLQETVFGGRGMILEIKVARKIKDMERLCEEALAQIEDKQYEEELREEGYQEIIKYGVCFFKKGCLIKQQK